MRLFHRSFALGCILASASTLAPSPSALAGTGARSPSQSSTGACQPGVDESGCVKAEPLPECRTIEERVARGEPWDLEFLLLVDGKPAEAEMALTQDQASLASIREGAVRIEKELLEQDVEELSSQRSDGRRLLIGHIRSEQLHVKGHRAIVLSHLSRASLSHEVERVESQYVELQAAWGDNDKRRFTFISARMREALGEVIRKVDRLNSLRAELVCMRGREALFATRLKKAREQEMERALRAYESEESALPSSPPRPARGRRSGGARR